MRVKPKDKTLIVLHPDTGTPIPAAGMEVTDSAYMRRRINDGDLVRVSKQEPKKA